MWKFDPVAQKWKNVLLPTRAQDAARTTRPTARWASTTWASNSRELYLFGGITAFSSGSMSSFPSSSRSI